MLNHVITQVEDLCITQLLLCIVRGVQSFRYKTKLLRLQVDPIQTFLDNLISAHFLRRLSLGLDGFSGLAIVLSLLLQHLVAQ